MNPSSRTIASTRDCSRRSFDELPEGMRERAYAEVTASASTAGMATTNLGDVRAASGVVIVVDLTKREAISA